MLGFYTFTGCGQTGNFNGKSKEARWKVLMRSKDKIYSAFSAYGKDEFGNIWNNFFATPSVVMAAQLIFRPLQINYHQQCPI